MASKMDDRLKDRLRAFMESYGVKHEEMSRKLSTPYGTFQKWMRVSEASVKPPACMLTLMNILEHSHEARKIIGIKEPKA